MRMDERDMQYGDLPFQTLSAIRWWLVGMARINELRMVQMMSTKSRCWNQIDVTRCLKADAKMKTT